MNWSEITAEIQQALRLRTHPVAYRRLEQEADLDRIENVYRPQSFCTFCQALFWVRFQGLTVGLTENDKVFDRCKRIHGLKNATENSINLEADMLSTTWFASPEEALIQLKESPRIPSSGTIVVSPLHKEKVEPEVVLFVGNPAQLMLIMCGLQKEKFERFPFFFIGEGACADGLAQSYVSGKPALAIPCYGERAIGQIADDEILLAMPPGEIPKAISGMKKLAKLGFKYPISFIGGQQDLEPLMRQAYPMAFENEPEK